MRSIDNSFYKTKAWKQCRANYLSQHSLCERCLLKGLVVPADIVHHKIHLTKENVTNPEISLSFDNLESLCQTCHNQEHFKEVIERRYSFDAAGNLIMRETEEV